MEVDDCQTAGREYSAVFFIELNLKLYQLHAVSRYSGILALQLHPWTSAPRQPQYNIVNN